MVIKILTEAGKDIGWGHVSRCSALFEEIISRNIEAKMYLDGEFNHHNMLENIVYHSVDWKNISFLEKELKSDDLVIVDSYRADYEILKFISDFVAKVLFIDDYNRLPYPKGIILNPSFNVNGLGYPKIDYIHYLYGKDYIILRKPFAIKTNRKLNNLIKRVLITLGGEDSRGLTQSILNNLIKSYSDITFDVVHKDTENLKSLFKNYNNINYHTNLSANQFRDLMLNVDFCITASGQTTLELMATKTPFLPIKTEFNQSNIYESLTFEYKILGHDLLKSESIDLIIDKFEKSINKNHHLDFPFTSFTGGNSRIINKLLGVL